LTARPKPRLRILLGSAGAKTTRIFKELVSAEGGDLFRGQTSEMTARLGRDERFDAIFADTALPNLSGSGFVRIVRKSKLNGRAPLVLLAGLPVAASCASQDLRVMAKFTIPDELPPIR
jgi:DNA-binding response OmpR family regulator